MNLGNNRSFAIKITGNHFFACDYVFSNVYGESVFFDDAPPSVPADGDLSSCPTPLELSESTERTLRDTLPETPFDALSTLPDCTKKVEYMTEGAILSLSALRDDGLYIRYGSEESPMCIHIRADGSVSVSGDETDTGEIVFEEGKRNFIALPESLFSGEIPNAPDDGYEKHTPFHLCVSTESIDNKMTESGGSLSVRYSIEVNGMIAEISDFTLTADRLAPTDDSDESLQALADAIAHVLFSRKDIPT